MEPAPACRFNGLWRYTESSLRSGGPADSPRAPGIGGPGRQLWYRRYARPRPPDQSTYNGTCRSRKRTADRASVCLPSGHTAGTPVPESRNRPLVRSPLPGRGRTCGSFLLMDNITVLVLADPTEPRLAMLEELPPETTIVVGNSLEAFV